MGVGGARRGFRVVLHRERGYVEERDALGRAVVEVHVRELDASEALVLHHRRDAAAHPAAQVVLMRADAGR